MKSMEEAKRKYDEIPIPSELSKRVGKEIEKANMKRKKILVFRRRVQKGTAAAAAVVVLYRLFRHLEQRYQRKEPSPTEE